MVDMFNKALTSEVTSLARTLTASYEPEFTLDTANTVDVGGTQAPVLQNGGKAVNLDFTVPDRFTLHAGGNATVFAASGDDFIRVSTSVKKENGERAVGTKLDRGHAAYPLLRAGKSYVGLATLFGKQYMTEYDRHQGRKRRRDRRAVRRRRYYQRPGGAEGEDQSDQGRRHRLLLRPQRGAREKTTATGGPPDQGRWKYPRQQGFERPRIHQGDAGDKRPAPLPTRG